MEDALLRACASPTLLDGWTTIRRSGGDRKPLPTCAGGGRRRPPPDVHIGHHGTPQGRHDHPRQPGVEEPGAHHRVRLHELRPRAGLRTPVPRRRARPDDHLTHRCGCDHDHPSLVRGVRRRRRARTIEGDHGVAGAGHGQRDHGGARHRGARPLVGTLDHQRRREDADPAHRADPAHVSLRMVRRRVRADRDGLR